MGQTLIEAKVPMTLAALGGSVDVPTPSGGKVRVSVPLELSLDIGLD